MTTTPAAPRKTATAKKAKPKGKQQGGTAAKLLGIPGLPTRQQALDTYARQGAETFTERRLIDITEAVQRIAFWVTLWSVLSLVAFGIALLVMIANSR